MSVPLERLPPVARTAWMRLRDALLALLDDDLVAIWAHGGTTAIEGAPIPADLDTYVIIGRPIDERTAEAIERAHAAISADSGVEWDAWYVLAEDARRPEPPQHAYREGRRDTAWAISRARWLAGRYALVYGLKPDEIVPPPTWGELEIDLDRELEHVERHVSEGDTDPFEATYAILNGSRILHTVQTRDVAVSKRSAGRWALDHLPVRWHAVLRAANRAYDGQATADDLNLLAREMGPFVAMVRERLPSKTPRGDEWQPRWSGY
jgi:hypothetical protein